MYPIERSQNSRILKIDFLFGKRGFRIFQFRLRGPKIHLRLVVFGPAGGVGGEKLFLPFVLHLGVLQLRLALVDFRLRFFDCRLVNRGVDLEKFGALLHQISFLEIGFGQKAGNVGGKVHNVTGLDFADFGDRIGKLHFDGGFDNDRRNGNGHGFFFLAASSGEKKTACCHDSGSGSETIQ